MSRVEKTFRLEGLAVPVEIVVGGEPENVESALRAAERAGLDVDEKEAKMSFKSRKKERIEDKARDPRSVEDKARRPGRDVEEKRPRPKRDGTEPSSGPGGIPPR